MSKVLVRILVVDDEPSARLSLAEILRMEGYAVNVASGGQEAIDLIEVQPFDIVITDLKMPDVGGLEVLKASNEQQPNALVILLTAYGTLDTVVAAMRTGGFDYLVKPTSPADILAAITRAQSALEESSRRQRLLDQMELTLQELKGNQGVKEDGAERSRVLAHAGIVVDLDQHTASAFGNQLDLTPTEFSILALLMRQPGRTFASEEIMQAVKGFSPVLGSAQAAVRVYISRLRQKIESDPKRPRYLQTVRGVGYRFTP